MSDLEQIEKLKHSFNVKPSKGNKLPNPKDVSDAASFYLKEIDPDSNDTWVKHKMINGVWMKEVVRASDSAVVFQKV